MRPGPRTSAFSWRPIISFEEDRHAPSKRLLVFALAAGSWLGAVPGLRPAALQAADLESIAFSKEAPGVVFSVRIRGEFGNEAFTLGEPERLVIDLSPIEEIGGREQPEVNEGGVLRVRIGRFQADVARLVFDLDGPGVMYRIDRTADGLKITFWKEGKGVLTPERQARRPRRAREPCRAEPEKPAEAPPAPVAAPREEPAARPPRPRPPPSAGDRPKGASSSSSAAGSGRS